MTDTGQVPGEGLPENAGMVEQPVVPVAYTYLSETTAEDEDLLLLPGAQSPWGNEVAPPAPEPVVETVHEPGPHEMSGRDSGVHDLSAVRTPQPQAPSTPIPPVTPRRPLHLGPPIPDASASPVRSLADRGPAGAPVRQPAAAVPSPEYSDTPQPQGAVPWGAPAQAAVQTPVSTVAPAAETVVPAQEPVGAAQSAEPHLASEAEATEYEVAGYEAPEAPVPDAVQGPESGYAPEPVRTPVAEAGQVLADGSGADGVQPDGGEEQVPGDGSLPDGVQLAPAAGAELPAEQFLPDGPVAEAVPDPGADAEQAPDSGPSVDPVEDAVAVPDPVDAAEAMPVVETPAAAVDADDTPPVAEEAVAEPEAVAVQEAVASEAVTAEDAETGTVQEPDASHEAVVVPEAEAAVEEAAPVVAEDVVLQAPVEAEQVAPQPADAVTAPDEVLSTLAEDPAAEAPEPLTVEETAPAPERIQEPAPAALPAEAPQAHHFVPPAPQGPVAGPADAPAQEAPEPLAADVADTDVQAMDPAAPAEEVQSSDPVAPQEFPAAPDQTPQGPQMPAAQPLAAEVVEAQTQFAYPAPAEAPAVLPAGVPLEPRPGEPLGEFVPVDGSVPTTPHLAPTPPHPLSLPTDDAQQPVVPAPREAGGDPEPAQQADDLDTRAADQEDREVQEIPEVQEEVSTAAVEEVRQSTGPAAPAYDDAEREAVLKVMRERRDIRNGFRSDPIPHEVLLRVLEAAHTAPSVGHSQPWDFVVIRSAETRAAMQDLAQRQREAYAKSLPKGRAKQFKELKIEAILETPVNIVVTADPTRGGRHTLGRHTQPQMAPYSAALAVENLWLAARAEGLGVGWVSFFDEREMVRALGLPEHLEVIAYLCVGYVDEFPDEPELMQAGWSKRRPLSWVVHEETYGRRALPGEEPHDLLGETVAQIRPLDAKALGEAWERQKRMTKPAGALGMLEIISAQLSGLSRQCPPPIPEPAAVAIFAGDHGVHAQGVTPWPQEVTAQMVANFLGGGAVCNAFAAQVGAEVCVVDVGVASELPATPGLLPRKVRAGTSDMTTGPAMTRAEAKQAIEVGIETARDLVAAGNKALLTGEMGIANTTASAALISVYTGTDPADVTGRGTGINDETLARKTEVVRRAIDLHQPDPADPIGVLAAIGGFEHAAMVGLLLGGASLRTPVILDGVSAGAAALVARAIAPEVLAACIAGHRSAEPGHVAALNKLGLRPLVDLDLRLGEGTGALLALPLVQSTARAMHEVATFDSAGVTEK
ncbi:nicotinate-nucleotide--dimethylbenzimidazole phosphoribosyltransferase [Streptomyces canus]|uniref:nicotinate-nucleotide--dimethylbenzimidazole phosphoribosyltransferase n=1 Tax=Streptomyces canus TaxID=58343 RepID=UPI00371DF0DA